MLKGMREWDTAKHSRREIEAALTERDTRALETVEAIVRGILDDVRGRGDAAVVENVRRFDWPDATAETLELPRAEIERAGRSADDMLPAARAAAANIAAFHRSEMGRLQSWMDTSTPGRVLGQILQPVKRVGIYVPGGKASYPSTLLMTAIPARVAGVAEIVMCTPARKDGALHPLVTALAADHVDRVFRIGGAAAIAAMAHGTETVPRVDVIVGPGNDFVNTAKRMVYGAVGLDMLAGPSEVAIVADAEADPGRVVADLLAQTEHDSDNRGVLFSTSTAILDACRRELTTQRERLLRREILEGSDRHLLFVKTATVEEAIDLANVYAPEHLELFVAEPLAALGRVRCAGAVLLGPNTSAPAGDYLAGPSHTLPTAGTARFSSPLSCNTFLTRTSVLYHDAATAAALAEPIAAFAEAEGFDGHAAAARRRAGEAS